MVESSISAFKAKLTGGGARSNLFEIVGTFPVVLGPRGGDDLHFFAKGGQIPPSDIATITVPFRGRQLKVPGDRTYESWTITVLNDENFKYRNAFEQWHNLMNDPALNVGAGSQRTGDLGIYSDWFIYQLDRTKERIQGYKFVGLWPQNIGPIEVSTDNENTIEEYTVTLEYQYWVRDTSLTDVGVQTGII